MYLHLRSAVPYFFLSIGAMGACASYTAAPRDGGPGGVPGIGGTIGVGGQSGGAGAGPTDATVDQQAADGIPDGLAGGTGGIGGATGSGGAGGTCLTPMTSCPSGCVDTSTNPENCGSCGTICLNGTQTCSAGHCRLVDGQGCTTNTACASGVCSPFYVDADGDTYGSNATAGLCGISPPAGYATRSGDCCDSNGAINPSADFQTGIGNCSGAATWDYNCSGNIEQDVIQWTCLTNFPTCGETSSKFPDSQCGMQVGGCSCGVNISGTACTLYCQGVTLRCH
jgi:hypothetical protein